MTDLSLQSIRTTPGRDLIALVIGELDRDAEAGRKAAAHCGAENVAPLLLASHGLANALRTVLARGDDRTGRLFADAIRSSLLSHYAVPVPTTERENAA